MSSGTCKPGIWKKFELDVSVWQSLGYRWDLKLSKFTKE